MSADVLDGQTCWIVGQAVACEEGGDVYEGSAWLFQGVFATEDLARAACHGPTYFIGPALMNEALPEEPRDWPNSYYPWEGRPDEDPE